MPGEIILSVEITFKLIKIKDFLVLKISLCLLVTVMAAGRPCDAALVSHGGEIITFGRARG